MSNKHNRRKHYIPTVFRRKPFSERLPAAVRRRISTTRNAARSTWKRLRSVQLRIPLWSMLPLALALGFGGGVFVMKQRQASREVIVAVGGARITADDFHRRLESEAGPQMLRKMVNEELTLQYARRQGVSPSDKVVAARMAEAQKSPEFNQYLFRTHQTTEDVAKSFRVKLAETALFETNVSVTDADVLEYYRHETDPANPIARFYTPDTATVSIILTSTEQAGHRAAEAIAGGKDFAAVARQCSQDNSAATGGNVAPIHRGRFRGRAIPGLEQAIFSLNAGEQFGPRLFGRAWWIVRCREKDLATTRPLASVRELCMEGARVRKGVAARKTQIQDDYNKFKRAASLQVFWEQYHYDLQQLDTRMAEAQ